MIAAWQDMAACVGKSDLFYPEHPTRQAVAAAQAVCAGCPVRAECADAGRDEPDGVWGGVWRGGPLSGGDERRREVARMGALAFMAGREARAAERAAIARRRVLEAVAANPWGWSRAVLAHSLPGGYRAVRPVIDQLIRDGVLIARETAGEMRKDGQQRTGPAVRLALREAV